MKAKSTQLGATVIEEATNSLPLAPIKPDPLPAPVRQENQLYNIIAGVLENPRVNVEKVRALLDMQREHERDQRHLAFMVAMAEAQEKMQPIVRADAGERKKYAKLERIDNEIRPIYTAAGFSLSFNSQKMESGAVKMMCKCFHKAGWTENYELEGDLDMSGPQGKATKTSIQGLGSSVSYLRRYLTLMIFNVTLKDEDNDGNGDGAEKPDKFADKAKAEAKNHKPAALPTTEAGLRDAATVLRRQLKAAKDKPARDVIVAANLPLMRALDEKGLKDIVKRLHEIIDGTNPQGDAND
jgi:hypothetical protein